MRNVLITGANGQLGSELKEICQTNHRRFYFTDAAELDITQIEQIRTYCLDKKIDTIVNCAAYTQVDKAEDDAQMANLVNNIATLHLATVCRELEALLIHVSTDYVFDGEGNTPYMETDPTNPLGVYGKTKLEGEKAIEQINCRHIIIRTSWLYSSYGHNFVKTIKKLSAEREELKVVFDQVGTPTYAGDLANVILQLLERNDEQIKQGIYHYSNEGVCSWYDFAVEINRIAKHQCNIQPCHSDEFPTKVRRPNYSVLDKTNIKKTYQITIPHWIDALNKCMLKL